MHCVDKMKGILMLWEVVHMIIVGFARICISVRCRLLCDPNVVVKRPGDLNTDCRVDNWH